MVIINSGMPKSATTLLVRYQKDLVSARSKDNGIAKWKEISNYGYVDAIDAETEVKIRQIHENHGDFVVKTHCGPTRALKRLIDDKIAKATFSFRDPRDTMLSAKDHGDRTRAGGDPSGAFRNITSIDTAMKFAKSSIDIYRAWVSYGNVLFVRYEEFMQDRYSWLKEVALYLQFDLPESVLKEIYLRHEDNRKATLNFNKGTTERWKDEMSLEDQQKCLSIFGDHLRSMGYES